MIISHLTQFLRVTSYSKWVFRRSKLGLIMPEMGLKKLNLSLEAYNADTYISPKGKSLKMQKVRPA